MKPQTGTWFGTLVVRERSLGLALIIHLENVNDDGTLSGRLVFPTEPERWQGADDGQFVNGRYSSFGTLHLEQLNIAEGIFTRHTLTVDARFDVPDGTTGAMWGSVCLQPPEEQQAGYVNTTTHSGALVAAHASTKVLFTLGPGVWG